MRHLNYGHLLYFWTVAREGGVARASEVLHVTPQTISGQLRILEESVGEKLFTRVGRRLVLSEMGKLVFEYAEEIFTVGAELAEVVRTRSPRGPVVFRVGITDVLPKLVASRVLEPALALEDPVRIVCLEGKLEALLADLAVHRLDMVLSDRPAPDGLNIRAYTHPLGDSGVTFFSDAATARRLRRRFPRSLGDTKLLLPTSNTVLRRSIDAWLEQHDLVADVAAEFEDSALLKAFGRLGKSVFPGPTAIESDITEQYHVSVVGRTDEIREAFYAISPERRLKNPAAAAITETARSVLFAS